LNIIDVVYSSATEDDVVGAVADMSSNSNSPLRDDYAEDKVVL
jgi:hypothetical protein